MKMNFTYVVLNTDFRFSVKFTTSIIIYMKSVVKPEMCRHTQSVFFISEVVLFRETFVSNNSAFSQVTTLNPGV